MLVFGAGSALSALSDSSGQLIAFRAVMGFGGAFVLPATLAIIMNVFERDEQPKAIGIWTGVVGFAIAIGPITGGMLLEHFWWGSVFLVNVPIVVAALVAMVVDRPRLQGPQARQARPVRRAAVDRRSGAAGLRHHQGRPARRLHPARVLGDDPRRPGGPGRLRDLRGAQRPSGPRRHATSATGGSPRPSPPSAWSSSRSWASPSSASSTTRACAATASCSPVCCVLPLAASQMFFAPRARLVVDRFGARAVCATGLVLTAVAFAGFLLLGQDTPIWVLEVLFFLMGTGMAHVMPPATVMIMSSLPREKAGSGSAVNNTFRQVGGAMGSPCWARCCPPPTANGIDGHLGALPVSDRHAAGESVEATLAVAEKLGPAGKALVQPANDAFIHAMHLTALGSAAVALLGAVVVLRFLPRKARRRSRRR